MVALHNGDTNHIGKIEVTELATHVERIGRAASPRNVDWCGDSESRQNTDVFVVNKSGSKFDAENRLLQGLVEPSELGSANRRASRRGRRRHLSREGFRQEHQEQ